MLRHITAGIFGIAALGFALPAGALTSSQAVNVNVEVAPLVSVWTDFPSISLLLDGANAENSKAYQASIKYLNNVPARIDVNVTGTLPTPLVGGGGVNFFIFDGVTAATAVSTNIVANAYNPAGALAWTNATLGTPQPLDLAIPVNNSAVTRMITYAADAPGELPNAATFNLVVTYTMSAPP